eukprot:PITA_27037
MLHGRMSYGLGPDDKNSQIAHNLELPPQIPVLANGHSVVSGEILTSYYADNQLLVNPAMLKRVHPSSEPGSGRIIMDPNRDIGSYGFGNVSWKERGDGYKSKENKSGARTDEARQPLSQKVPVPSSKINPYGMVIVIRMIVLGIFLRYRLLNPVKNAYGLWATSIVCEIWFALSWILDQFPKWLPISRETYLDRLSLRYEREGEPSMLAPVDLFVSTVDPLKEPPLVTANTTLSILSVDYPVNNVSCYVSDDGAS